jgi:glycosyltransferase involved in cell wall biosynthesis
MAPERVLVVDMHDPRFPLRMGSFQFRRIEGGVHDPEVFYASFVDGILDGPVDRFLDGLTHVYTAETGYDPRFYERCRLLGVESICHVMPEFDRFTTGLVWERPDRIWLPTEWRREYVDPSAVVVPVPCPVPPRPRRRAEVRTVVHVGGSRAMPDRSGSRSVFDAVEWATDHVRWIFYTQHDRGFPRTLAGRKNVEIRVGSVEDRWALYDEADLLIAPRRFGGLSLPVLEAAACGLPVLMLDVDPMARFAGVFVTGRPVGAFETAGGVVELYEGDPWLIGQAVTDLVKGDNDIGAMSDQVFETARLNSWPCAVDFYRDEIEGS